MPFKSEKQRRWMWANDPEMAKKWEKKEKKMKETKVRKLIRKMVREIMSEAFGGELSNSEKKKFEKVRKEQSEVLGYKLTGKSDIKEGLDLKKLETAIKDFQNKIKKQGRVTNARDEDHLKQLIKVYKQMGGRKIKEGKLKEDYKNSEWEVYLKDEKGREKIVKKAKSKRAATILYNKIIKSDDYFEVGMRVVKEGKITESRVAKTILQQLGGNKFIAMTGAKNLGASNKSLSMKIGRNSKSINYVVITLKSSDLYDVEFIRIRGAKRTVVKKLKGVYADQLQTMFTKYTGMRTSL